MSIDAEAGEKQSCFVYRIVDAVPNPKEQSAKNRGAQQEFEPEIAEIVKSNERRCAANEDADPDAPFASERRQPAFLCDGFSDISERTGSFAGDQILGFDPRQEGRACEDNEDAEYTDDNGDDVAVRASVVR
jgi:hypothetical protein